MPAYDPPLAAVLAVIGPTELASKLGIVPSAITQWRRVPVRRVKAISEITGMPKYILRPDIFDAPADTTEPEVEEISSTEQ